MPLQKTVVESLKAEVGRLKEELRQKALKNTILLRKNLEASKENKRLRNANKHVTYDRDNFKEEVEKLKIELEATKKEFKKIFQRQAAAYQI